MFSWDSPALVSPDRWPTLAKSSLGYVRHERLRGLRLVGPAGPPGGQPARTVRYAILHGLHDEAAPSTKHLLLKMQARAVLTVRVIFLLSVAFGHHACADPPDLKSGDGRIGRVRRTGRLCPLRPGRTDPSRVDGRG
ncbi:MAG: hypothetical protein WKF75_08410 [Singulisphaera sp.]